MTTTTVHADFTKGPLTAKQLAWLRANGIDAKRSRVYGFYFSKGSMWIEPVAANASTIALYKVDRDEDGDGAVVVDTFGRLRDALRALASG